MLHQETEPDRGRDAGDQGLEMVRGRKEVAPLREIKAGKRVSATADQIKSREEEIID